jgi:hypothetical protein
MTIAVIEEETIIPSVSAVAWPAIAAGALVAIAASLILFSLGSGLGFAAASPWGDVGRTAAKISIAAAIWLIVVQWIASAAGGYLAGRLRTRWHGTHTHEVFFRDTAHGLLAWGLATVVVAIVTAAVAASTTGAGVAAAPIASNFAYDADALYRTPTGDETALVAVRAEAVRLLGVAAVRGSLDPADHDYLVASVAARTGIPAAEATQRVDAVVARERQAAADAAAAADKTREAAAALGFMTALAMVVGAFIASLAGALGGAERDKHP